MWLGNSEHHLDFPGTLSAAPRTYLNLLKEVVTNFLRHGFRTVILLNGHGGNIVPAQQALFELRQEYRDRNDIGLFSTTYWTAGERAAEVDAPYGQHQMGHACDWETSMMLYLHPELVGDFSELSAVAFDQPCEPAHWGWIMKERSALGYIGDPAAATAEKGARLFDRLAGDVLTLLERIADAAERGEPDSAQQTAQEHERAEARNVRAPIQQHRRSTFRTR
jgi:creatinine amidohydrolase